VGNTAAGKAAIDGIWLYVNLKASEYLIKGHAHEKWLPLI
jgi:hypothetical protein